MQHKWTDVGGCQENPGITDTGNGGLIFTDAAERMTMKTLAQFAESMEAAHEAQVEQSEIDEWNLRTIKDALREFTDPAQQGQRSMIIRALHAAIDIGQDHARNSNEGPHQILDSHI